MIPDLLEIGFVRKLKGFQGLIKVATKEQFEDALVNASFIFINMDGSKVPFGIERVELANDVVLKLDQVTSSEDATALVGKELYLPVSLFDDEDLGSKTSDGLYYGHVHGYSLIDTAGKKVGTIEIVEQYPGQEMATLTMPNGRSALVPLVDAYILEVDQEASTIKMDLPEGVIPD